MHSRAGYLLSQKEHRLGSPEKPLSDLGFLTYRSYWKLAVVRVLNAEPQCSLEDITLRTGMKMDDVLYTLQDNQMLHVFYNGTPEGRLPPEYFALYMPDSPAPEAEPAPNDYTIHVDAEALRAFLAQHDAKKYVRVQPDKLRWTPFLLKQELVQK